MSNTAATRVFPECWGHRGASSRFPENTLASFEAAIRDGAEGIESDVHVSLDDVIVMFHDPDLGRTTNSSGRISERNWYGEKGIEHVRTIKEPIQPIPTFNQVVDLLMKPENMHVKFNIDVKLENEADRLFSLMHKIISAQTNWEKDLAPRLLLGIWHTKFLPAAKQHLPYCRRSFIGSSPSIAKKYFWNDVEVFSIHFNALANADGEKFRKECKDAGKQVMVWTVNLPDHMMEAVRWEVDVILTDCTKVYLDLRDSLERDYDKISAAHGRAFLWTGLQFYSPVVFTMQRYHQIILERAGGPFTLPSAGTAKT